MTAVEDDPQHAVMSTDYAHREFRARIDAENKAVRAVDLGRAAHIAIAFFALTCVEYFSHGRARAQV